jgi:hypothetical protein
MMDLSGELRSTSRHLRRRPGQSALIIGVLGLGIGWVAGRRAAETDPADVLRQS